MPATPKGVDPMRPQRYRIDDICRETHDTFTLKLNAVDDAGAFVFAPGQFNMLYSFGVGEVPISISGNPGDRACLVHTIRSVGSVTRALCGAQQGDMVGVRGPFGSPWPVAQVEGQDVVVVTGGIGLAPLRPAIYHVLGNRERYGNVVLLYGARTPKDILYAEQLQQWRGRFDVQVEVTVDAAPSTWRGNVGVVTNLMSHARFDPLDTIVLACGPEIMMRFTVQELLKVGVAAERIYVSLERNMKCAVGFCGHCQYGPNFVCKDGPVFRFDRIESIFGTREI